MIHMSDIANNRGEFAGPVPHAAKIVIGGKQAPVDPRRTAIKEAQQFISASISIPITKLIAEDALKTCPRVWIIGGGPSLRSFDFSLLEGEVVIAVNKSFLYGTPGCCISMDENYLEWLRKEGLGAEVTEAWKNFKGVKLVTCIPNAPVTKAGEDPYYIVHRSKATGPFSTKDLGEGNNSGFMALKFAASLGAKDIRLLGFDMGCTTPVNQRQEHFHGGYPNAQPNTTYGKMIPFFNRTAPLLKDMGVSVTVYGPTALQCFPVEPLENVGEIISTRPVRPLVVGYYTVGTGYEKEIVEMERSARFFGLETDLMGVPDPENWYQACLLKPQVIQHMMNKHKGRDLLFLDADSRIRRYPGLFNNYPFKFGYCTFDWDSIPGNTRVGQEVSSAVLYIKDCGETRGIISTWVDATERNLRDGQKIFDQVVLSKILPGARNLPGVLGALPMSYNQIFDSMAGLGAPVIEQMQASRRLGKKS